MKKGNQSKLKVAKSSQGYYVGWLFQEDEVTKSFVRLTDYLMSKIGRASCRERV